MTEGPVGLAAQERKRVVLHVGCGIYAPERLHPSFRGPHWREIRVDLDPRVKPDVIGSVTDLSPFTDESVEAVWSSHNIEHLYDHEATKALAEFRRVLKPDGIALITTPDVEAIAKLVAEGKLDQVAYMSPAGPITALDMLYGHRDSIRAGNHFMAHKTAFSAERLGRLLMEAGFSKVVMRKGQSYDLWACALMPRAVFPEPASPQPAQGRPE
ncbi:class I SAM-dependent methyltransferase [Methylobacterium sp. sgz302541]|uniref:class I SAM-dependent methyltransferase n=1 Tax=unclassified Methylobacterium TaxID=2615210 RepID=UPI003D32CDF3